MIGDEELKFTEELAIDRTKVNPVVYEKQWRPIWEKVREMRGLPNDSPAWEEALREDDGNPARK